MQRGVESVRMIIEAEHLSKRYRGSAVDAVSDLSFSLEEGTILAFLGPNGAGKTTTVKMIAGLVAPTSGAVRVAGADVTNQRAQAVVHIGAVLEGARNLYWRLSAWDNILYFGGIRLVPSKELEARGRELLASLGLDRERDRQVRTFSRGMQQKLAIVCALLHDPDLLLLDEPTLGLDVQSARKVEEFIVGYAQERGKAILLTTHQMGLAERVAHEVLVIRQGHKVAHGDTGTILAQYGGHEQVVEMKMAAAIPPQVQRALRQSHPSLKVETNQTDPVLVLPVQEQAELVALMREIDAAGLTIDQITYRRLTLEEVFLRLTAGTEP